MLRVDQYSRRTKKLVAARAAAQASKQTHLAATTVIVTPVVPIVSRPRSRSIEQAVETCPDVFEKLENMLISNGAETSDKFASSTKPRDRPSHRRVRTCFLGGDVFAGMSTGAGSSLGPQGSQLAIRVVE